MEWKGVGQAVGGGFGKAHSVASDMTNPGTRVLPVDVHLCTDACLTNGTKHCGVHAAFCLFIGYAVIQPLTLSGSFLCLITNQ